MSDVVLNILGNSDGAQQALKHVAHEAGELHEVLEGALKGALGSTVTTFSSLETVAEKAAEVFKEFATESIKDFASLERETNQLRAAAGGLSNAFIEQAEAQSRTLNMSAKSIEHLDTLLLRYGAAPDTIGEATTAIANFAAVTGKDADSAMMQLIRGVESGTGSLGKLGVSFKATGDFSTDLKRAVEALNERFTGAAETDAHGLAGRTKAVSLAMERLHETFGAMFDRLDKRYGVLEKVAKGIDAITDAAKRQDNARVQYASGGAQQDVNSLFYGSAGGGLARTFGAFAGSARGEFGPTYDPEALIASSGPLFGGDEKHKKGGGKSSDVKAIEEQAALDESLRRQEEYARRKIREEEEFDLQEEALAKKEQEKQDEVTVEMNKKSFESWDEMQKEHIKDMKTAGDVMFDVMKDQTEQQRKALEARKEMWARAGTTIAQTVLNALFEALAIATDKSKSDKSRQYIGIAQGIMNGIFSAFGMGGISSAAFGAINADEKGGEGAATFIGGEASGVGGINTNHSGGYIQRFHRGGWPTRDDEQLSILQTGERVLSRREVGAMGGAAGVEAAVRGGSGGRSLTIQAFDASSLLEFFGDRGGRGMMQAARANIGPLRLMFGKV